MSPTWYRPRSLPDWSRRENVTAVGLAVPNLDVIDNSSLDNSPYLDWGVRAPR